MIDCRDMEFQNRVMSVRYPDDAVRLAGECAALDRDALVRECLRKAEACAEFSSDYCRIAWAWHEYSYGAYAEISACVRKAERRALYPADHREIEALKEQLWACCPHRRLNFYPAAEAPVWRRQSA